MTELPSPPMVTVTPQNLYPGYPTQPEYDAPDSEQDAYEIARAYDVMHTSHTPRRYHGAYEMPESAHRWVQDAAAKSEAGNLVLMGPVGTGKTYSAVAAGCLLATTWRRRSNWLFDFTLVSDLMAQLKNFDGGPEKREEAHLKATKANVLVLDDLGRGKSTEFDAEGLGRILDHRLGEMLPTIITTNVFPKANIIDRFGDHLASRLLGGATLVLIGGPDRRFE